MGFLVNLIISILIYELNLAVSKSAFKWDYSEVKKAGRNEICSCGSGKKFKKCCGAASGGKKSDPVSPQRSKIDHPAQPVPEDSQFTASVKDYFETDYVSRASRNSKLMSVDFPFNVNIKGETSGRRWAVTVHQKLNFDYEANAIYLYLYVTDLEPEIDITQMCKNLIDYFANKPLRNAPPALQQNNINLRDNKADRFHPSGKLIDTRQIVFYLDAHVPELDKALIYQHGDAKRMFVKIRDRKYAQEQSSNERPLAFISYDGRDKDEVARPLAHELTRILGRVWFDEFSLRVGDSLRESIERGLRECSRCILVLTPNYLSNKGWTKTEFNSVFTRELVEKSNVIIPVWAGVSTNQVYDYSPTLADRLAANWDEGCEAVCQKIRAAILESK